MPLKSKLVPMLAAVALFGCEEQSTSLVVTVDSELGVPCAINKVTVEVTTSGGQMASETVTVGDADLPGSITFTSGGGSGQLTVRVTGLLDDLEVATAEEVGVTLVDGIDTELRFVLSQDCANSTCGAVAQGEFNGLPAKAARTVCGQERYSMPVTNASPRSACDEDDAVTVLTMANESEVDLGENIEIPFRFFFYGRPVTNLWVGDNGYLTFTPQPNATTASVGDPRSLDEVGGFPVPGVLPFWDKTQTTATGVCAASVGTAPNRRFRVSWDSTCFEGAPCGSAEQGNLTYSVTLNEADGSILVGFVNMQAVAPNDGRANGQTAVVGLRGYGEPACSADMCVDGECTDSNEVCNYTQFSALEVKMPLSGESIEFAPE